MEKKKKKKHKKKKAEEQSENEDSDKAHQGMSFIVSFLHFRLFVNFRCVCGFVHIISLLSVAV